VKNVFKIILIILGICILYSAVGWDESGSSGKRITSYAPGIIHYPGQAFGVKTDDTLWAWGSNQFGQLGNVTATDQYLPVQISGTGWASIVCGAYHTLGLKTDGSLWAWGDNRFGQLGNGTAISSTVPVQIGNNTDWLAVACGEKYSVAIKNDGTLWSWGNNNFGQLGDGTQVDRDVPTQISGTGWAVIACGTNHTLAIKSDTTLWAWGNNESGQLGIGTEINKNTPAQITGSGWSKVTAGLAHSVALKNDATVWAWGYDWDGEVGDGDNGYYQHRNLPVQLTGTGWTNISAGRSYTMALKTDGTLWAWGSDNAGQLGDGNIGAWVSDVQYGKRSGCAGNRGWSAGDGYTNNPKYVPTRIGTDNNWLAIAAGSDFAVVLKNDGALWAWGDNYSGQLGDGTTADRKLPAKSGTDTNWAKISASK